MELVSYLRSMRRHWILVVLTLAVTTSLAYALSARQTKVYESSVRLIVSGASTVGAADEISLRVLAASRAEAYADIASTGPAIAAAMASAGLAGQPQPSVQAGFAVDKPFVTITVRDTSPLRAQRIAAAFQKILPVVTANLEQVRSANTPIIGVVRAPGIPTKPVAPRPVRNAILGALVGLALGAAAATFRDSLDRTYSFVQEVEEGTGETVLGGIPRGEPLRLPILEAPDSRRAEGYRLVRTNIEFTQPEGSLGSVVVTSALAGEGKTSLACNLAIAWAQSGRRVIVVDADLRRPRVAEYLGVTTMVGLTEVLRGQVRLSDAIVATDTHGIKVLSSGQRPKNPSELLASLQMHDILRGLEAEYDVVLVDSAPLGPVADTLGLASMATGTVLTLRIESTTRDSIAFALSALRKVNARILGLVPNELVEIAPGYAQYYYSEYGPTLSVGGRTLLRRKTRATIHDDLAPPMTPMPDRQASSDNEAKSSPASVETEFRAPAPSWSADAEAEKAPETAPPSYTPRPEAEKAPETAPPGYTPRPEAEGVQGAPHLEAPEPGPLDLGWSQAGQSTETPTRSLPTVPLVRPEGPLEPPAPTDR